jgi:hypothetical protein
LYLIGDAVLYMNLDGGNGGEACPSIADSSAVSLSQMAFLSMTVSVFSVVARYVIRVLQHDRFAAKNNKMSYRVAYATGHISYIYCRERSLLYKIYKGVSVPCLLYTTQFIKSYMIGLLPSI